MATLRDDALAAYNGLHADWIRRGREKLRPVFTDKTGTLKLDPLSKTVVSDDDGRTDGTGLLVLTTSDGSNLSFAVYPDRAGTEVALVKTLDGGQTWTRVRVVADLDDVGQAIAEGRV